MKLDDDIFEKLENCVNKIASEIAFARPGKDDGLLPTFSMLKDIEEFLPQEHEIYPIFKFIRQSIEVLLDAGKSFDDEILPLISSFLSWWESNCLAIQKGGGIKTLSCVQQAIRKTLLKR